MPQRTEITSRQQAIFGMLKVAEPHRLFRLEPAPSAISAYSRPYRNLSRP